jgi:hypothetical protein
MAKYWLLMVGAVLFVVKIQIAKLGPLQSWQTNGKIFKKVAENEFLTIVFRVTRGQFFYRLDLGEKIRSGRQAMTTIFRMNEENRLWNGMLF